MSTTPSPDVQVQELLQKYDARLVRQGNHQVWQFPDGKKFVRANTPSDRRSSLNNLSDLKKLLGPRVLATKKQDQAPVVLEELSDPNFVEPTPQALPSPETSSAPTDVAYLASRLDELANEQDTLATFCIEEAQKHEHMSKMLRGLREFANDKGFLEMLDRLVPRREAPIEEPKQAPIVPRVVSPGNRVQVTRRAVWEAILTLPTDLNFTVNSVRDVMADSRECDPHEKTRVRMAIASCMVTLTAMGKLTIMRQGKGRQETLFEVVNRERGSAV